MKKVILMLVAVAFLATTVLSVAVAADPKEAFTIDFLQNKKPPVVFPHKKHSTEYKLTCKECHHTMADDKATPKACKDCHKKGADTVIEGVGTAPDACGGEKCNKKNIFHLKCKKCHKDNDKGPTKCKECHVK